MQASFRFFSLTYDFAQRRHHARRELSVVASRICEGFFFSGSPRPSLPTSQNSNSTRIEQPHENQLRLIGFLSKYCSILNFIYLKCVQYIALKFLGTVNGAVRFQNFELIVFWGSLIRNYIALPNGAVYLCTL